MQKCGNSQSSPFDSQSAKADRINRFLTEQADRLDKGGVLLCGLDIGTNYIVDQKEEKIINALPFNPLLYEAHRKQLEESDSGWQFSHSLTEQIGGQLRVGFSLTDIYEDTNGEGRLHELQIPSFIATRAVK